jgi:hypothetical protein
MSRITTVKLLPTLPFVVVAALAAESGTAAIGDTELTVSAVRNAKTLPRAQQAFVPNQVLVRFQPTAAAARSG